jgi:hypothetical protein
MSPVNGGKPVAPGRRQPYRGGGQYRDGPSGAGIEVAHKGATTTASKRRAGSALWAGLTGSIIEGGAATLVRPDSLR